jgi:hypothetical protein
MISARAVPIGSWYGPSASERQAERRHAGLCYRLIRYRMAKVLPPSFEA